MPSSRLRLRRQISPWHTVYQAARWVALCGLLIALVGGTYRFLTRPYSAGALEFVPHVIGTQGGSEGVLGTDAGDIDGDGDIDIATAGLDGVKVFINNGRNSFEQKIVEEIDGERVQIIDINRDGQLDLLTTIKLNPSVRWYRNNGDMEFTGSYLGTGSEGKAYAGDINADGDPDVVTATNEGGIIILRRWMNQGDGTFVATVLDGTDTGIKAVTIGDVNANGYRDIVTGGTNGLQAWDTSDGSTWTRRDLEDADDSISFTHIALGDINTDDKTDIVVGDQTNDEIHYYRNLDNNAFERSEFEDDVDALTVKISDLDEDGHTDVLVAGQDDNNIYWFKNNEQQEFALITLASNLQSVFGLTVSDIDDDGDQDFITADHRRGTIWWYERVQAKPVASEPTNIRQASNGTGVISFDSTISDSDKDPTKLRIQYSLDGDHWYKPWLTSVKPAAGSVDLKNSNGYQVGTSNRVDTDENDSVKVTFFWDTKSVKNTGGPIVGDIGTVRVRVIPADDSQVGKASYSAKFRVDNTAPQNVSLKVADTSEDTVTLSWTRPSDSSTFTYKIYYGTDQPAVLEKRAPVWESNDDDALDDVDTTSTEVNDLQENKTYYFKLFVIDEFGNVASSSSVNAKTVAPAPSPSPGVSPVLGTSPAPSPSPGSSVGPAFPSVSPTPGVSVAPSAGPIASPVSGPTISPFVLPSPSPSPETKNSPPTADAGTDLVVNPSAVVVLDGSASFDPDNKPLTYSWRQLSGPTVDLISSRTSTPSFSAGDENEVYIFAVTVRDEGGMTATDTVTVATKILPKGNTTPVDTGENAPSEPQIDEPEPILLTVLRPIDIGLFVLALISTLILLGERVYRSILDRNARPGTVAVNSDPSAPKGRVIHHKTGQPIAGAQILIYGADNKLRATDKTNERGEFSTLLPAGTYTIDVKAVGFSFASTTSKAFQPENGMVYSGGKLTVTNGDKPLDITVPMKPAGEEVSSLQMQALHIWQQIQKMGRMLSWPLFVAGALLNTVLIFWKPGVLFLTIEVLYVILVIMKVALEVRVRPAYGVVRDAITHIPLDLAVIRLYEQGSNRVIMTRVADAKGRFFAIPPAGVYTISITKPGYAVFSKDNVSIQPEQDSVLQLTADLMPVAPPTGGLRQARASVL